jgi:hypothetical protein
MGMPVLDAITRVVYRYAGSKKVGTRDVGKSPDLTEPPNAPRIPKVVPQKRQCS